jgi:hypothetical protein
MKEMIVVCSFTYQFVYLYNNCTVCRVGSRDQYLIPYHYCLYGLLSRQSIVDHVRTNVQVLVVCRLGSLCQTALWNEYPLVSESEKSIEGPIKVRSYGKEGARR